ncbi:MAG: hypothetical protein AAGF11_18550 [Myxococcota bacterium]
MATLANGHSYFFLRLTGPFGLGHIGWGLQFARHHWLFGSLENQDGKMSVGRNGDNDYWWSWSHSEAEMFWHMRTMLRAEQLCDRAHIAPYTYYKKIRVRRAQPNKAEDVAYAQSGYGLTFNNCLDNTARIGDAYGVRVWSWSRHIPSLLNVNMSPKGFFFHTLHRYHHRSR